MSLAITPLLPPPPEPVARPQPEPTVEPQLARASTPAFDHPQAVITESAEPIYINERRDTVEAPPLVVAAIAGTAPSAAAAVVATVPMDTTVPYGQSAAGADDHIDDATDDELGDDDRAVAAANAIDSPLPSGVLRAPAEPGLATDDLIAAERGLIPLRVPSRSTAFVPLRIPSARKLVAGSLIVTGLSLGVAIAAVVWARGAVADARASAAREPSTRVEQAAPIAAPDDHANDQANDQANDPADAPANTPIHGAAPTTCSVIVSASSQGATVWVDGTSRGPAPTTITGACDSTVKVEVRHPRYAAFERELVLAGNLELDARLERQQTELTVWSEPAGAEVIYDGQVLGKTPLTAQVNRYEQGHMYFRAPGYESDWRQVVPKAAKKTVAITLKKAR